MYSLFLYDTTKHIDPYNAKQLTLFLQEINFIKEKNHLLVPSVDFMQMITFLGCSPNLNHEIETQITSHLSRHKMAIGGDSISKLICPICKTKINDATALIKNYKKSIDWFSSCCQNKISLEHINWRKSAGFSHTFIQISNIFPKEAIPSDELLLHLSQFSHSTWKYFYSKYHIF